jgi:hypothetical protein
MEKSTFFPYNCVQNSKTSTLILYPLEIKHTHCRHSTQRLTIIRFQIPACKDSQTSILNLRPTENRAQSLQQPTQRPGHCPVPNPRSWVCMVTWFATEAMKLSRSIEKQAQLSTTRIGPSSICIPHPNTSFDGLSF